MKKAVCLLLSTFTLFAQAATSPKEAYDLMLQGKAVLVDVREKDEIEQGMIKQATWFPLSKVTSDKNWKEDFLKITASKKIFLYCRSGRRSGQMMATLKENHIDSENIGGYESLKGILP